MGKFLYTNEEETESVKEYMNGVYGRVWKTGNPEKMWKFEYYFEHAGLHYLVESGFCDTEEDAQYFCNVASEKTTRP